MTDETIRLRGVLGDFTSVVEQELARSSDVTHRIDALMGPFTRLLTSGFLRSEFVAVEPGRFLQYLVYRPEDRSYSLMAMTVAPGVETPVHDHLAWGLVGVYEGEQYERVYQRVDDGSETQHAELRLIQERRLTAGEVTTLIPPVGDIHQIRTVSLGPSVSLHLLGNDIGCQMRHAFDVGSRSVADFRSGYVNAECDPL